MEVVNMENRNCTNPHIIPLSIIVLIISKLVIGDFIKTSINLLSPFILINLFVVSIKATIPAVVIHIPLTDQFKYRISRLIILERGIAKQICRIMGSNIQNSKYAIKYFLNTNQSRFNNVRMQLILGLPLLNL